LGEFSAAPDFSSTTATGPGASATSGQAAGGGVGAALVPTTTSSTYTATTSTSLSTQSSAAGSWVFGSQVMTESGSASGNGAIWGGGMAGGGSNDTLGNYSSYDDSGYALVTTPNGSYIIPLNSSNITTFPNGSQFVFTSAGWEPISNLSTDALQFLLNATGANLSSPNISVPTKDLSSLVVTPFGLETSYDMNTTNNTTPGYTSNAVASGGYGTADASLYGLNDSTPSYTAWGQSLSVNGSAFVVVPLGENGTPSNNTNSSDFTVIGPSGTTENDRFLNCVTNGALNFSCVDQMTAKIRRSLVAALGSASSSSAASQPTGGYTT